MSNYLFQVAYTPEAWANMLVQPHDRIDAVRPVIEKLGGKVVHAWFAFGDYDVVAVAEMPTNVEAAAFRWPLPPEARLRQSRRLP
jgi:uncharacterized protein with GYD domain